MDARIFIIIIQHKLFENIIGDPPSTDFYYSMFGNNAHYVLMNSTNQRKKYQRFLIHDFSFGTRKKKLKSYYFMIYHGPILIIFAIWINSRLFYS